jgi:hypothetical protein
MTAGPLIMAAATANKRWFTIGDYPRFIAGEASTSGSGTPRRARCDRAHGRAMNP